MTAIPDLLQVQLAKETTWGTPVTPTVKLMGIETCKLTPINDAEVHPQMIASLGPGRDANLIKIGGTAAIGGAVLYEDLPYWLDSIFAQATPTGAGPYTYAYVAPLTAAPVSRILTLTHGDGTNIYCLEGAVVNKLVISGANGGPLKFSADLIGENVVTDSLASLSDRAVNFAMPQHLALYIDTWGGTMGGTAYTGVNFNFELTIEANRAVYHGMALKPAGYRDAKYKGTLKLSLEFVTASKAYLDAIVGGSAIFQRLIRIKASNTASLDIALDFAGTTVKAPVVFSEVDGVVSVDLDFDATYHATFANWFKANVINGVATLP